MKNIFVFATSLFSIATLAVTDGPYRLAGQVAIKGQGGWDYPSLQSEQHRLFVSHSDRIVVIDLEQNKVIKEILDTSGVHAIVIADDLKRAYSTNGKENKVAVIDLNTLAVTSKIDVGQNPDAAVYDQVTHELFVFNGKSHSASVIDTKTNKVVTTIDMPGKPEFAVVDSAADRVFVNIEDKNSILAIDAKTHFVTATFKLEGCERPSGLAIDLKNHRLFSVCENEKMVMVDAQNGHILASVPTGKGTDGVDFDGDLMTAIAANGQSGTATVVHEDGPSKITVLQNLKTQLGARTIVLDKKTHKFYLPTADLQKSETSARPKPVEGTQRVLVYERSL